eukprot:1763214-Rhodomonas_salina.1
MKHFLQGVMRKLRHCREGELVGGALLRGSVTLHQRQQEHVVLLNDWNADRLVVNPEGRWCDQA